MPKPYVGYFSPILDGGMHLRALTITLVSYLEARSAKGKWLVCAPYNHLKFKKQFDQWLLVLEAYGFEWDNDSVEPFSNSIDYDGVIHKLLTQGLAYACHCSDEPLQSNLVYSGICRDALKSVNGAAIRLRTPELTYQLTDRLQGLYSQNIGQQVGDFIIRDKFGVINADFVMVLDDAKREITQIIRGFEFLSTTPKQLYLQELLGLASPSYLHVPKLCYEQKHPNTLTALLNLDEKEKVLLLINLLKQLNQPVSCDLQELTPKQLVAKAVDCWHVDWLIKSC